MYDVYEEEEALIRDNYVNNVNAYLVQYSIVYFFCKVVIFRLINTAYSTKFA